MYCSSTSNSFVGNSSRNTTDMIPEIQVNKPSFVKKQLRKSNSINPEEMINKLIRNQNCLQKEIQQKNRRVIQKDNKISKKVLTEPQDQLSRVIDSHQVVNRFRNMQRQNFCKKLAQL